MEESSGINLMEPEELTPPIDGSFVSQGETRLDQSQNEYQGHSDQIANYDFHQDNYSQKAYNDTKNSSQEFEEDENDLPDGWIVKNHRNTLPFYYHLQSGSVVWTKPYVRKFRVEVVN